MIRAFVRDFRQSDAKPQVLTPDYVLGNSPEIWGTASGNRYRAGGQGLVNTPRRAFVRERVGKSLVNQPVDRAPISARDPGDSLSDLPDPPTASAR